MGFHDVLFPIQVSYGSKGGPGFNTQVTSLRSGAEERVSLWSTPRYRFDAASGIQTDEDFRTLAKFFYARLGAAHTFRVLDVQDHATGADWKVVDGYQDVEIASGDGSTTTFQLIKKYDDGSGNVRSREIILPVGGTVRIGVNGIEQTISVDFTIDTVTGIVTFTTAPTSGHVITAGFEFHVHCRFGVELDAWLDMTAVGFEWSSLSSMPIIESKDQTILDEETYFGGAQDLGAISANVSILALHDRRVVSVDPQVGSLKILLPTTPSSYPTGGPLWVFHNNSGAQTMAIIGEDGVTTIKTLAVNGTAMVFNALDSSGNTWIAF